MNRTISREQLARALALRDLTQSMHGPHAMQALLKDIVHAVARRWCAATIVQRAHPVVTAADNYDRLGYPADGASRDARYTRYVAKDALLRTQTSAMIPRLLEDVARHPLVAPMLLVCPGLVYRRDAIDRWHVGEPHQVDLWLLSPSPLDEDSLETMITVVVGAALPDDAHVTVPSPHPYTERGRQIDVGEVEIGECGLASRRVLATAGLGERIGGLAMGLGLDRLLMLRKRVDDIRLLRAKDPRIAQQMLDLGRYRPVSRHPLVRRDLSIAVDAETDAEALGDRVREALAPDDEVVEAVTVISSTDYAALPTSARDRMGMNPTQKNVLLRVVLRHMTKTLSDPEANVLRDRIYRALHEGSVSELAG